MDKIRLCVRLQYYTLIIILPGGTVGYPAQPGLIWRNRRLPIPTRINLAEEEP